ncbi:MAG: flippase-like domain-containing protein [Candidatus Sericytochromatia bacterium]|nr:flippase-like domain-containing protein [Candidatus Tanganyikabacteria bacterium]
MLAALRVALSIGLLAAVLAVAGPGRIRDALVRADWRWVALAAALWLAVQWLNVAKWALLARSQGLLVEFRDLLAAYFVGMFFNTFLPSGFGGDVARAYRLARLTGKGTGAAAAINVAIDRGTSLYALILLAAAATLAARPEWRLVPLWAALGLAVAGGLALAWFLRADGRALAGALFISLVFQALAVVLHYCLVRAMGIGADFAYVCVFFPILALAASLPITINGLAVREGGFAFFLGRVGAAPADAVAVGLLSLALLLASGAAGAVLVMRNRGARPAPEAA